jgi:hypothetical protein
MILRALAGVQPNANRLNAAYRANLIIFFPFRIIGEYLARLAVEFGSLLADILEVIAVPGQHNGCFKKSGLRGGSTRGEGGLG